MFNNFKNDLRNMRTKAGWTFAKVSEKTGVPLRTLENWESGDRTPPDYVARLVLDKLRMEIEKDVDLHHSNRRWYRLIATSMCFKKLADATQGASLDDEDAQIIKLFSVKEEAYTELAEYTSSIELERTFYGTQYRLTEWHVEEYEGDDYGEFISGSSFDSCKMPDTFYDSSNHAEYVHTYDRFGKSQWIESPDEE